MLWTKRSRILPIETFNFLLPVFRCLSLVFVKRHWSSTYILPSSSTSFTFHMVYACMCAFRLKRIKLLRVSLIIAQYYIIPDYPSPNPPPPLPLFPPRTTMTTYYWFPLRPMRWNCAQPIHQHPTKWKSLYDCDRNYVSMKSTSKTFFLHSLSSFVDSTVFCYHRLSMDWKSAWSKWVFVCTFWGVLAHNTTFLSSPVFFSFSRLC